MVDFKTSSVSSMEVAHNLLFSFNWIQSLSFCCWDTDSLYSFEIMFHSAKFKRALISKNTLASFPNRIGSFIHWVSPPSEKADQTSCFNSKTKISTSSFLAPVVIQEDKIFELYSNSSHNKWRIFCLCSFSLDCSNKLLIHKAMGIPAPTPRRVAKLLATKSCQKAKSKKHIGNSLLGDS